MNTIFAQFLKVLRRFIAQLACRTCFCFSLELEVLSAALLQQLSIVAAGSTTINVVLRQHYNEVFSRVGASVILVSRKPA